MIPAAEIHPFMSSKRRSFETGHRPKFMVVVDETPECDRAAYFAGRRAARTGASLLMLAAVSPPDNFEWVGVGGSDRRRRGPARSGGGQGPHRYRRRSREGDPDRHQGRGDRQDDRG
jgi:hypothetical protein